MGPKSRKKCNLLTILKKTRGKTFSRCFLFCFFLQTLSAENKGIFVFRWHQCKWAPAVDSHLLCSHRTPPSLKYVISMFLDEFECSEWWLVFWDRDWRVYTDHYFLEISIRKWNEATHQKAHCAHHFPICKSNQQLPWTHVSNYFKTNLSRFPDCSCYDDQLPFLPCFHCNLWKTLHRSHKKGWSSSPIDRYLVFLE